MKRKHRGKSSKYAYKVGELEGSNEPLIPPKMRPCRKCGKDNVNYYVCTGCAARDKFYRRNAGEDYSSMLWGVNV